MPLRYGFVSTFPPTQCGLATFTAALLAELVPPGTGSVISVVETPQVVRRPEVAAELIAGDPRSLARVAFILNQRDAVIVQHEYGIYGGEDGDEVVTLLRALTVPTVVVLHTVLSSPTPHQKTVLEDVVSLASAVVTMTGAARDRLVAGYAVDPAGVSVIPHGAPVVAIDAGVPTGVPTVLSWGLLGRGKGIEWGIDAIALLRDLPVPPRYVVAGQTHPKVLAREGEAYRDSLIERAERLGVPDDVVFDSRYRTVPELVALVAAADVVLIPYDSTDQVTSGVLIEAIAAGRPVVSTRFPHAVELLGGGLGILVAHGDPVAMADALRTVLTSGEASARMRHLAAEAAPSLQWPAVAQTYRELIAGLVRAAAAA
jgi:glycosyltransferase involved in cell wall biosynthesis